MQIVCSVNALDCKCLPAALPVPHTGAGGGWDHSGRRGALPVPASQHWAHSAREGTEVDQGTGRWGCWTFNQPIYYYYYYYYYYDFSDYTQLRNGTMVLVFSVKITIKI